VTATLGDAPDWQGYSQWRSSQGTKIAETISIGNPYTSQVVVTNWASFNLYAVLNSGTGFTIIVTWFNDAAYSQVVDTQEWVLNVSSILNVTLPCLTPYAEIEFNTGESGNQTILAYFTPQNLAVTKATYLTESNLIEETSVVVGAGDNVTYKVPYVMVGKGCLTVFPLDSSGEISCRVLAYDESAAFAAAVAVVQAPASSVYAVTQEFTTPARPIVVELHNNGATTSHSCDLYYQGLSQ